MLVEKTTRLPVQEDRLRLREVAPGRRAEQHVPVVVRVFISVGALSALAVHGPEEAKDEHDCTQNHTTQAERLQSALARREEGGRAAGDDEEDANEHGAMMQRRHRRTLTRAPVSRSDRALRLSITQTRVRARLRASENFLKSCAIPSLLL